MIEEGPGDKKTLEGINGLSNGSHLLYAERGGRGGPGGE